MVSVEQFDKLDAWRWKKVGIANIVVIGSKESGKTTLTLSLLGNDKDLPTQLQSCERLGGRLGTQLTIHDTPALEIEHYPIKLSGIDMVACSSWIFTINMQETRFEENSDHITLMENITRSFGKDVWNKATIVLTFANILTAELDPLQFEARLKLWTDLVRKYLHEKVKLGKEVATSVPVIAAGLPDQPLLTTDPEGTSYLNDIWLSLLLRSKCDAQPHIIKLLLRNLFKGPVTSGKHLFNLMTNQKSMYYDKLKEFKVEPRAVKACIFWHTLRIMLHNHLATYPNSLYSCQTTAENHYCLLRYWKSITHTVNIIIAGEKESGKTALLNSLFYGKEVLGEKKYSDHSSLWEKIKHNDYELAMECRVRTTEGGLFDDSLAKACIENEFNLVFYCISIHEDQSFYERNIQHFTDCLGRDVWKKTVVIITFANCLDSGAKFETETKTKVESLRTFFHNYLGENVVIGLAGYHNNVCIPDDPKKSFWCIDIWMKAIPVAQTNSHPALITWLNTNTTLHKTLKMKKSSPILSYYKKMFIDMLCSIVDTHNLS